MYCTYAYVTYMNTYIHIHIHHGADGDLQPLSSKHSNKCNNSNSCN